MTAPALTWTELAQRLGFTARGMRDWRKLPNAPDNTDPAEWTAFIEGNGLGTATNRPDASREELLKEKLRKDIEKIDIQNAKAKRLMIDREEVRRLLLAISVRQRTILYQSCESDLPPKLDGLPASEARKLLRDMADGICDAMAGLVKEFEGA